MMKAGPYGSQRKLVRLVVSKGTAYFYRCVDFVLKVPASPPPEPLRLGDIAVKRFSAMGADVTVFMTAFKKVADVRPFG